MAELYERSRPGYPPDAIAFLRRRLALGPGRTVVDLGAGTGKLTRPLLETRARVIAVEPLAEMRSVLARVASAAEVVAGAAEALPLEDASVDAVAAGQAFHWFDPEPALAEIARVLRPGGTMALVWNLRELSDRLQVELNELLRPYRGSTPNEHGQGWRELVAASGRFGAGSVRAFAWAQPHTAAELVDRIASVSFVAQLDERDREPLLARVRALGERQPQPFPFRYRCEVSLFALGAGAARAPRTTQAAGSQGTPSVSQPTRQ